jgi:hypothetical protein
MGGYSWWEPNSKNVDSEQQFSMQASAAIGASSLLIVYWFSAQFSHQAACADRIEMMMNVEMRNEICIEYTFSEPTPVLE